MVFLVLFVLNLFSDSYFHYPIDQSGGEIIEHMEALETLSLRSDLRSVPFRYNTIPPLHDDAEWMETDHVLRLKKASTLTNRCD